jgi:hypothetical protein
MVNVTYKHVGNGQWAGTRNFNVLNQSLTKAQEILNNLTFQVTPELLGIYLLCPVIKVLVNFLHTTKIYTLASPCLPACDNLRTS